METIGDEMETGDKWRRNGDEDKDDGDGDEWKNDWRWNEDVTSKKFIVRTMEKLENAGIFKKPEFSREGV